MTPSKTKAEWVPLPPRLPPRFPGGNATPTAGRPDSTQTP